MNPTRNDLVSSVGLLILRLGAGAFMLTHGWGKLQQILNGNFQFGDPIGIGEAPSLVLATGAEFFCALLVMFGFATRFAAVPVAFTMAVAAFVAHREDPWTMGKAAELFFAQQTKYPASKEPALLYLTAFLALAFTGAGRFSLDAIICSRWRKKAPKP